jgi:hypothetical protein
MLGRRGRFGVPLSPFFSFRSHDPVRRGKAFIARELWLPG